jgi:hypothetical protein
VNDATGFSPFPGNINQLVFQLEPYVKVLERTGVSGEASCRTHGIVGIGVPNQSR